MRTRISSSILKNPWDKKSFITIEITNEESTMHLEDRKALAFVVNIKVDGKSTLLKQLNFDNCLELSPHKNYEIVFKNSNLGEDKQIKLPNHMNANLLKFLTGGRRKNETCMDFINDMYFGCNSVELQHIFLKGTLKPLKDEKHLVVGQAIAIGNELDNQFKANHFAIYLGHGLYLSVMGTNIPLFVTTLEQMKIIYNDQKATLLNPVQKLDQSKPTFSYKL